MIDDIRSTATRKLRRFARGHGRTQLRRLQAKSRVLSPGRTPGPPDFVGIGVQRAGSSWWHSILESHPQIDPLGWTAKELHYFDERWNDELTAADVRRYAANFLRRPGHLAGEWTPRYLSDPWAVPLLHRAAPQARLLVILRDPVERFRSGLAHARDRLGGVTPDVVTDAIWRGRYATQLAGVLAIVPREQVLVLQLEQCRTDVQGWAERTFAFLGLDSVTVTDAAGTRNASATPFELSPALLERLRHTYADEVRQLQQLLPQDVDVSLWRNFADLG